LRIASSISVTGGGVLIKRFFHTGKRRLGKRGCS
jgi:hypothetical protein